MLTFCVGTMNLKIYFTPLMKRRHHFFYDCDRDFLHARFIKEFIDENHDKSCLCQQ